MTVILGQLQEWNKVNKKIFVEIFTFPRLNGSVLKHYFIVLPLCIKCRLNNESLVFMFFQLISVKTKPNRYLESS